MQSHCGLLQGVQWLSDSQQGWQRVGRWQHRGQVWLMGWADHWHWGWMQDGILETSVRNWADARAAITQHSDTLRNSAISWCCFSQSSEGVTPTQTIKLAAQITSGFPLNSNKKNPTTKTGIIQKEKCGIGSALLKQRKISDPEPRILGWEKSCLQGRSPTPLWFGVCHTLPLALQVCSKPRPSVLEQPSSTGLSEWPSPWHSKLPLHPCPITNSEAFPLETLLEFLLMNLWRQSHYFQKKKRKTHFVFMKELLVAVKFSMQHIPLNEIN